ncbi:nicotinate (nicotinamide) nucleotide adenylyltransferase [bacterium]|nr:nicotinate (nicotinamide) nucleotide adenylyltransferase [bacterium]
MATSRRIALFGGTFDPIHTGHLEIAQKAQQALDLNEVIFLPCQKSPHKTTGPVASDQERYEMLQLATAKFSWASVSDFELRRPLPNYTWATVEALKNDLLKGSHLFLLIGLDQWEALPRWSHPEKLAAAAEFIVVGRDGEPKPREGYHAHFLPGDHPASASEIRSRLSEGKSADWLPTEVAAFITKKDLY